MTRTAWRRAIVILACLAASVASAQVSEYRLKAAFLYNFTKFVEWPAESGNAEGPISICTLGRDPFAGALEDTIKGKAAGSRPLLVRKVFDGKSAGSCHILFIGASEEQRFRAIAGDLQGRGILTVGETEGFLASGGIINFKLEAGTIRLEINMTAAEYARLRISSKLLTLAHVVRSPQ